MDEGLPFLFALTFNVYELNLNEREEGGKKKEEKNISKTEIKVQIETYISRSCMRINFDEHFIVNRRQRNKTPACSNII